MDRRKLLASVGISLSAAHSGCLDRFWGEDRPKLLIHNYDEVERQILAELKNAETGEILYKIEITLDGGQSIEREGVISVPSGGVEVRTIVDSGEEQIQDIGTGRYDRLDITISDGETTTSVEYYEV